uniref:GPI-anchored protein LLG1-like domain-containing protein n=1 Tax=Physcomitrium patens TaxID=3218 RepID=A0A2K1JQP8_PHYPA|nr:hypothetical protein PHYPA_016241 [Physcomitrium patens]
MCGHEYGGSKMVQIVEKRALCKSCDVLCLFQHITNKDINNYINIISHKVCKVQKCGLRNFHAQQNTIRYTACVSLDPCSPHAMALVFLSSSKMRCLLLIVAPLCVVSAATGDGGIEAGSRLRGSPSRQLLHTVTGECCTLQSSDRPNPPVLTWRCCDAFTTYACPCAEYINNSTTNCWRNLFTYLTLAGNYPEQLFLSCFKTYLCIVPSPVPLSAPLVTTVGDP